MKKLLLLLAVASLLLCGCGKEEKDKKDEKESVPPMSIAAGKAEAVEPADEDIVIPITQQP